MGLIDNIKDKLNPCRKEGHTWEEWEDAEIPGIEIRFCSECDELETKNKPDDNPLHNLPDDIMTR